MQCIGQPNRSEPDRTEANRTEPAKHIHHQKGFLKKTGPKRFTGSIRTGSCLRLLWHLTPWLQNGRSASRGLRRLVPMPRHDSEEEPEAAAKRDGGGEEAYATWHAPCRPSLSPLPACLSLRPAQLRAGRPCSCHLAPPPPACRGPAGCSENEIL